MLARAKTVTIPVVGKGDTSGVLLTPAKPRPDAAIVIAHGAGNDMNNPLLVAFAEGLSHAGYPTLRFNFLYMEHGRKTPDREETLAQTWAAAHRFLRESSNIPANRVVAAGKSLGGRIASQMVSTGLLPVERLIFLGYPLHPVTDREKLRDAHLYRIRIPLLFFAGSRDPLCDLDRLKAVLGRLHSDWELMVIEGGDHSFHLPKSMGIEEAEVTRSIVEKAVEWLGP